MAKRDKKPVNTYVLAIIDILLVGVVLVVFSLFHHVLPSMGEAMGSTVTLAQAEITPRPLTDQQTNLQSVQPTPTASPISYEIGDFSADFPNEDTGKGALYSYQSDVLRIAIQQIQENEVTYYVADVWVRNIKTFQTAFAKGQYGTGLHQKPLEMAEDNNAILAVTGDYYGARKRGLVIRNGNLYRDSMNADICVLYADGSMKTYEKGTVEAAQVMEGAWQAWSFGPQLLADGQAIEEFTDPIKKKNPRCAIGYYEPGHYCLVVVDGRQQGYSVGMTLAELSQLFASLGCKTAYNLDGGATAAMIFQGQVISQPYHGGRQSSDIICFAGGGN